jgi:putative transcriptional regulator
MFKKKKPVYLCRVGTIRRAKGLTVERLAKEVDVSKRTIESIELGKYKLSLELAYKISDILECRVEEVFQKIKVASI